MVNKITFNGQEYASVDEMPTDVRTAYEQAMGLFVDKDRDGTPDILEGIGQVNIQAVHTRIVVNGQAYSSVEEMPPEVHQQYEQAMAKVDADRNGVPDVLEGEGFSALLKGAPAASEETPASNTPKVDWNWSVSGKVTTPSALPDWMRSGFSDPKLLLVVAGIAMLAIAGVFAWVVFNLMSALR